MLLLIDNHDSFTYNLVDLLRKILGKSQFDVVSYQDIPVTLTRYSHLLLSPGPDVPNAYPQLFTLLEQYHRKKAILGVCLGHQTLCQYFGASLYNLANVRHGQNSVLQQTANSPLWRNIPQNSQIGLYHSWAVARENFPQTLAITAQCEQGIIMAMQHRQLPIYGVQFHPESFITQHGETMLRNWLAILPRKN